MVNPHKIKQDICEIGRRIYNKGFAAANDGNITVRIGENEVLCTPTMQSKGFLKPDDIATIDMQGNQTAGRKKRSSEALLHLEIYSQRPDVKSVVHCHPPHATAFAVAREPIPQCVLPEVEVFLGDVPITKYETPGGQAFADTILPFVDKTNVIILANHGTVSFGENVERAYWWTEILDAYCRILMLSRQLGRVNYFSEDKERELLRAETELGFQRPAKHARVRELRHLCQRYLSRQLVGRGGSAKGIRSTSPNGTAAHVGCGGLSSRGRSGGAGPSDYRTRHGRIVSAADGRNDPDEGQYHWWRRTGWLVRRVRAAVRQDRARDCTAGPECRGRGRPRT